MNLESYYKRYNCLANEFVKQTDENNLHHMAGRLLFMSWVLINIYHNDKRTLQYFALVRKYSYEEYIHVFDTMTVTSNQCECVMKLLIKDKLDAIHESQFQKIAFITGVDEELRYLYHEYYKLNSKEVSVIERTIYKELGLIPDSLDTLFWDN